MPTYIKYISKSYQTEQNHFYVNINKYLQYLSYIDTSLSYENEVMMQFPQMQEFARMPNHYENYSTTNTYPQVRITP
jgi:hypothetical protein